MDYTLSSGGKDKPEAPYICAITVITPVLFGQKKSLFSRRKLFGFTYPNIIWSVGLFL
jgi:hypothetical protein